MINLDHLSQRAELLRMTRRYFDQQGFLEVQPPCLARDCVVDAYLDPVTVDAERLGLSVPDLPKRFYLQTSPESAMKRMLAQGAPSIYSIGPVFRAGEAGTLHNVEFTMLEWYEVGGDAESAIRLLGNYVADVLKAPGYDRMTYRDAFLQVVQVDPIDAPLSILRERVKDVDSSLAKSLKDDRDGLLDVMMSARVSPELGRDCPVILTDYPLSQAALAKPSANDPACAARFELFARGIEIANGYDELTDPDVLTGRAAENNRKREARGLAALEVDTTLVRAMRRGLPECSGVALGLDRLLMVATGAERIDQVIPLPITVA
ncbi:EF-P lysine aminoacylase EpmA [Roseiconus nitratireducens]|nr:EF-P lysine aminoacylase EpmA [Roseiconus nitratireducens]